MPTVDLAGRRVLVTGASRGIGEAVAREVARRGATVALLARSAGPLAALAAELGGTAHPADLADPAQVRGLLDRVEEQAGGPVDVVVNNAGIDEGGMLVDKDADSVSRLLQVNLTTPIELCRQAAARMVGREAGHLVNVSSMAGSAAFPGMSIYAASKAGLSQFSRILARELRGTGVGVTLVELGPIPTDMLEHVNSVEPTRAGFDRGYKLRLIVDVPRERVATGVADAVERGRFSVVLPRRSAAFPILAGLPQRVAEVISTGLPTR